ncbi:MAG: hypothetical protein E6G26_10080 [Actinobacteria bacterium]|nr:MAG: hypothetical protein E6G26_10080 [Actinomycetota bacterium]
MPTFPLSGFTTEWYRQFATNPDLKGALVTSAIVAIISSAAAVCPGVLASIALVRRRFVGKSAASALLLAPLVIPYIVFGISLLLFFHAAAIAVAVVVMVVSLVVVVGAEIARRIAERRLGTIPTS